MRPATLNLMEIGGVEGEIVRLVEKERNIWLTLLQEQRDDIIQNNPQFSDELPFIEKEIRLLKRRLKITMTLEELKAKSAIRMKRYYLKRQAKKRAQLSGSQEHVDNS